MAPRQPRQSDGLSKLPEGFKAFQDGWKDVTNNKCPYDVVIDEDFSDEHLGKKLASTFGKMKDSITVALARHDKPVEAVFIYELLLGNAALSDIVDYTTEFLVSKKKAGTNPPEYREFLATRIFRSRIRTSREKDFEQRETLSNSHGFSIMDLQR